MCGGRNEHHARSRNNPFQTNQYPPPQIKSVDLAGVGLDLLLRALGALLADDVAARLALGGLAGVLGLLGLLLGGGGGLLLLALLDGGGAGGGAGLGALVALLLDHIEGSTNDGTLGLDGPPGALLGDLLQRGLACPCSAFSVGPRGPPRLAAHVGSLVGTWARRA